MWNKARNWSNGTHDLHYPSTCVSHPRQMRDGWACGLQTKVPGMWVWHKGWAGVSPGLQTKTTEQGLAWQMRAQWQQCCSGCPSCDHSPSPKDLSHWSHTEHTCQEWVLKLFEVKIDRVRSGFECGRRIQLESKRSRRTATI